MAKQPVSAILERTLAVSGVCLGIWVNLLFIFFNNLRRWHVFKIFSYAQKSIFLFLENVEGNIRVHAIGNFVLEIILPHLRLENLQKLEVLVLQET